MKILSYKKCKELRDSGEYRNIKFSKGDLYIYIYMNGEIYGLYQQGTGKCISGKEIDYDMHDYPDDFDSINAYLQKDYDNYLTNKN